MIIVRITSGLGNQMFQYAFYRLMQERYPKTEVRADLTWFHANNDHHGYEAGDRQIMAAANILIKNQLDKGVPLELGFDKWTNQLYGNKEFLMNCVNYLLDDNGLINIRSKDVDLPLLNKEEVYKNYTMAQMITVGLPIVILAIFGFLFTFMRKRKYSR